MKPKKINRILIANRGEIAVRIIRTCQEMGIETVAVFSEADRDCRHTALADQAVCIGPPQSQASYLNIDAMLTVALGTKADAIHPGYGFLAENPEFANACQQQELIFIGPSARVIRQMGNKLEALELANDANIPTLSGRMEKPKDQDQAKQLAQETGYPVLLKAAAGGGGRGMRLVNSDLELDTAFGEAQMEALSFFGNGLIYIEKFLPRVRHVEIQILADSHGHVIHLGERDCSLQRRYQKLLEESPSPAISADLREALFRSAVTLVKKVGYQGAGTVEFLVDTTTGNHYFIEVNARIQVEHPVTEMITGIDIVEQQIRISSGLHLEISQEAVSFRGHAIECRINAENPSNFQPSPGQITAWETPNGPGVRVDTHGYLGYSIPPYYDSLLAKAISWGNDRDQAIRRMLRLLKEFRIEGIYTIIPLHLQLLHESDFRKGLIHTRWLQDMQRNEPE